MHKEYDLNGIELTSKRLIYRTLSLEYSKDIYQCFTKEITKYMKPCTPNTEEEIKEYILKQQTSMSQGNELALVILKKNSSEFVGCISIHDIKISTPEIGIWIKEDVQRQGYGFETLMLISRMG